MLSNIIHEIPSGTDIQPFLDGEREEQNKFLLLKINGNAKFCC